MHSVKTINNQNDITNGVSGLDGNSSRIVNGNLMFQDANNSFTITPTGALPATNTTFNNITVNGTSTFNGQSRFKASTWVSGSDLRVLDTTSFQGIQIFNSNDTGNYTKIEGIGANSKFQVKKRDAATLQEIF